MHCATVPIDTDQFGTFTGEIPRAGTVLETLRLKITTVWRHEPRAELLLASEGSFGPHPELPFLPSDRESLLLFDVAENFEIFAEAISTETNLGETEITADDKIADFLATVGFPQHALIARAKGDDPTIIKDLQDRGRLEQAIKTCLTASPVGRVVLSTDMRAHLNPTRRKVITEASRILMEKIQSLCPRCGSPGFWIARANPGLPCVACGQASKQAISYVWSCPKCLHQEVRGRQDQKAGIDPSECAHCNP